MAESGRINQLETSVSSKIVELGIQNQSTKISVDSRLVQLVNPMTCETFRLVNDLTDWVVKNKFWRTKMRFLFFVVVVVVVVVVVGWFVCLFKCKWILFITLVPLEHRLNILSRQRNHSGIYAETWNAWWRRVQTTSRKRTTRRRGLVDGRAEKRVIERTRMIRLCYYALALVFQQRD